MAVSHKRPDPVRLEVFHHLLAAVCEEAGALLQRSAISPNIRDRRDFSFAMFDARGRLVAQAAHIPVHLGSAQDAVLAAIEAHGVLEEGDVIILNDPYAGGTHLPDITMVAPVYVEPFYAEPVYAESAPNVEGTPPTAPGPMFYLVNRAHHADVGGATPGSMGVAQDLHGEGLVLPPVKLRERGEVSKSVLALLSANVRAPDERLLDLQAQEASIERGATRLKSLCGEHGLETVVQYGAHLMDYSAKIARSVVRAIPDGTYRAEDTLENDGVAGGPFPIALVLTVRGGKLTFDFSEGTADVARGGINANRSIVVAACLYALRCLCPERLPTNDGVFRVLDVRTRPGSLLDPPRPAPVAGGNVETSQRLVDVCLHALAQALPDVIPACSAGTMSNLTLGGADPRGAGGDTSFAVYETLPGGAGAGPTGPTVATSAVQTHMTNTRNTSIEEFERRYPLLVSAWTVRRGSGGAGVHRGGDGVLKEVEARAPVTFSLFAERHEEGPPGIPRDHDAARGRPGSVRVIRVGKSGRSRKLSGKVSMGLAPGDRVRVETPGGGGWSP